MAAVMATGGHPTIATDDYAAIHGAATGGQTRAQSVVVVVVGPTVNIIIAI